MKLIEINRNGEPSLKIQNLSEIANDVLSSTKQLYDANGYTPPWGGYLAVEDGICVGTCAFKSAPEKNRVEIAYYTFPGNEGRGVATYMARSLVDIALKETPEITVAAQTLPEKSPSIDGTGQLASVLQHENDHLDGVLHIDYLSAFRKKLIERRLNQIKNGNFEADYPMQIGG